MDEANRLLDAFERAVRRHRGDHLAPESDLPCPRHRLREALELVRRETGSHAAEAALVELASFVPDEVAEADALYAAQRPRESRLYGMGATEAREHVS